MMKPEVILQEAAALAKAGGALVSETVHGFGLPGDAPPRRYFRVRAKKSGGHTWVMMLMDVYQRESNSFLLMQSVLHRCKVPCPAVLADIPTEGAILLDDLGDKTMLHHLEASMQDAVELDYFRKAIDLLVDIHSVKSSADEKSRVKGFSLAFDEEILNWEVNFTLDRKS